MARKKSLNQNDKSVKNQRIFGLQTITDLLISIGNPFYKLLLFLLISAFTFSSILKKYIRVILLRFLSFYNPIKGLILNCIRSLGLFEAIKQSVFTVKNILTFEIRFKIRKPKISGWFVVTICFFSVVIVTSTTMFWNLVMEDLPSPDKLSDYIPDVSTKIYDRNGILLYKIYKDKNRSLIEVEKLPQYVIDATIAIEDNEFFQHRGISVKGIVRSAIKNFQEDKLYGGSTITQQLIKNVLLSNEKTYIRKIKEAVLAIEVEKKFNKNKILEMYLNEVSFGGTAYGIEEASKYYFGKSSYDLNLAEAALLAGIPKSPSNYSPFVGDAKLAKKRQVEVLNLMQENGFISQEQRVEAENQKINFIENKTEILAPHFVMYVKKYLQDKYGEDIVEKGGLDVITSLDYQFQLVAEKIVSDEISKLGKYRVSNAAAIIVEPSTGEILAMVGSTDYFNHQNDGNVNAIFSLRPPGSTIKAINYSYALSNGYLPSTVINDSPITFASKWAKPYTPRNYDGKFVGNLTLRNAFAQSRNIPAVKVLNSYGPDKMRDLGIEMGIESWKDLVDYGLSITLGGGNVALYELAQAYSVFANYGSKISFSPIISIKNYKGEIFEQNKCALPPIYNLASESNEKDKNFDLVGSVQATESSVLSINVSYPDCPKKQVLDPRVAFIVTDILKDNIARSPAFGLRSKLVVEKHPEVAVKTGTSNGPRDNLTVGYTKDFLVAVWVGNNDNSPMSGIASGVTGATPIFNTIMSSLLQEKSSYEWQIPNGLKKISTCTVVEKKVNNEESEKIVLRNEDYYFVENLPKNACSVFKTTLIQNR